MHLAFVSSSTKVVVLINGVMSDTAIGSFNLPLSVIGAGIAVPPTDSTRG
jgi:hypothetical protein